MRKLYLDRLPGETRGVVVLDGRPERLLIERSGEDERPRLGERWRGRIGAAAPGFRGVFVDLGQGPAGLMAAEAGGPPVEGALVEVEVIAEARRGKGPSVRRRGSSDGPPGRVSAQARLEARLQAFAPDVAIDSSPAARAVADLAEEEALAAEHLLAGGLSLAVERTRGLTAVDVDFAGAGAGKRSLLDANLRAVREAARLLRLKALGGLAVIDLIGRASEHPQILAAAKAAFEPDGPAVVIAGLSRLGVLELSRPWAETPVAERLLEADGRPTARTAAQRLLRELDRTGRADPGARLQARCAADVAAALEPLARELGPRFAVAADGALGREGGDVRAL